MVLVKPVRWELISELEERACRLAGKRKLSQLAYRKNGVRRQVQGGAPAPAQWILLLSF